MAEITGGDEARRYLTELGRKLNRPSSLKVGFLSGSTYPDGTSVPMVAAIQEFGAPAANIPPRPFFRDMVAAHEAEWPGFLSSQLKTSDYDVGRTMGRLGLLMADQLQQSIVDFDKVPLKPATIARKGFAKQLIDTGHMLNSVAFEVDDGNGGSERTTAPTRSIS